jgi:hypothetical protein
MRMVCARVGRRITEAGSRPADAILDLPDIRRAIRKLFRQFVAGWQRYSSRVSCSRSAETPNSAKSPQIRSAAR